MGRVIQSALFIVVTMAIALELYPYDCDAAFAVYDGIQYAEQAERSPGGSISPHHPLFHVFVLALLTPLRAAGVDHAGHVAARIISGIGGAWLLLQIIGLAGKRRYLVGGAFAFMFLCTRGFVLETASGENVLPAAAVGLFALTLASRPGASLLATGAALTVAGLMRQDNVFLAPAVAWAVAANRPRGDRLVPVLKLGAGVLVASVMGYVLAWSFSHSPGENFTKWFLRFGVGSWTGPKSLEFQRFSVYFVSIAVAMTGRLAPPSDDQPWIGILWVAAILIPGLLLRGREWNRRLIIPTVITLIGRACFHTWYEADNFEWLIMPIAMITALASSLCKGEPATRAWARCAGLGILLALAAFVLLTHGKWTWKLRDRRLMTAVQEAAVDRTRWRFIVNEPRTAVALDLLGLKPYQEGRPFEGTYKTLWERGQDDTKFLGMLQQEYEAHPIPTVVILDRFVLDGMPYTQWSDLSWFLDSPGAQFPGWEILRSENRAYAARSVTARPSSVGGK